MLLQYSVSDLSVRQAKIESGACEMKRRQDDIEQKVIFAAQEIGDEGMNLILFTNCLQHYTLSSPFV